MHESDTETIVHVGATVPDSYLWTYRSDWSSLDLFGVDLHTTLRGHLQFLKLVSMRYLLESL